MERKGEEKKESTVSHAVQEGRGFQTSAGVYSQCQSRFHSDITSSYCWSYLIMTRTPDLSL